MLRDALLAHHKEAAAWGVYLRRRLPKGRRSYVDTAWPSLPKADYLRVFRRDLVHKPTIVGRGAGVQVAPPEKRNVRAPVTDKGSHRCKPTPSTRTVSGVKGRPVAFVPSFGCLYRSPDDVYE